MNLDEYKLTDEQKIAFLQKETTVLNDAQRLNEYQNFISCQKNGFLALMNYINTLLTDYKKHGDISSFVEFRARIKAADSAIANDSNKALDDIFGMELICATEDEINFLVEKLTDFMIVSRSKQHNKDNGYKAKHYYLYLNPNKHTLLENPNSITANIVEELVPMVEFQLKTIEVAIKASNGSAAHSDYKKTDKKQIQQAFDNSDLRVGFNLPFMWVSSSNIDNSEMKLLSADETAKVLYPFIDMTSREKHSKSR